MSSGLRLRFFVLTLVKLVGCVVVIAAVFSTPTARSGRSSRTHQSKRDKSVENIAPTTTNAATTVDVKPPVARVEVVRDTYFGETLEDPYRWMENDKDPDWLPFLKAQNESTRAVLDKVPGRDALLKRIQQLSGDTVQTNHLQRAGGKLFFQ